MPLITHSFVSAKLDSADPTKASKDEWNAAHIIAAEAVALSDPTGAQTIPSGVATPLTWSHEIRDSGGFHSTSANTSRITATKDGWYHVLGNVFWSAQTLGTVTRLLQEIVDSTTLLLALAEEEPRTSFAANGQAMGTVSVHCYLLAGQYVELRAFHDKTASGTLTVNGTDISRFSAVYLGT